MGRNLSLFRRQRQRLLIRHYQLGELTRLQLTVSWANKAQWKNASTAGFAARQKFPPLLHLVGLKSDKRCGCDTENSTPSPLMPVLTNPMACCVCPSEVRTKYPYHVIVGDWQWVGSLASSTNHGKQVLRVFGIDRSRRQNGCGWGWYGGYAKSHCAGAASSSIIQEELLIIWTVHLEQG